MLPYNESYAVGYSASENKIYLLSPNYANPVVYDISADTMTIDSSITIPLYEYNPIEFGALQIDDTIYMMKLGSVQNYVSSFNLSSKVFTTRLNDRDTPSSWQPACIVANENFIFAIGGSNSNWFWKHDYVNTGGWGNGKSLIVGRTDCGCNLYGNKIYAISGSSTTTVEHFDNLSGDINSGIFLYFAYFQCLKFLEILNIQGHGAMQRGL